MAKQLESSWAWVYNRHDRKRGTQPPDFICRNRDCAANLHEVGIVIYESAGRYLAGGYSPTGNSGGVQIEVLKFTDYDVTIRCGECECEQPHLYLEDIIFDPEAELIGDD